MFAGVLIALTPPRGASSPRAATSPGTGSASGKGGSFRQNGNDQWENRPDDQDE
jgi:hypothetical protein